MNEGRNAGMTERGKEVKTEINKDRKINESSKQCNREKRKKEN